MIFDPEDCRANFDYIKDLVLRNKDANDATLFRVLAEISAATTTPLIVVYIFAKEILGREGALDLRIAEFSKFYDEE